MSIKKYIKSLDFGLGIILGIGALFFWVLQDSATSTFDWYFTSIFATVLTSIGFLVLLHPVRDIVLLKPIIWILRAVIYLFSVGAIIYHLIFIPVFVFVILYAIPIVVWKIVNQLFGINADTGLVPIYISLVFATVVFSYRGLYLLYCFQRLILCNNNNYEAFIKTLTIKSINRVHFRRRAYEFATLMYIISVIEKLNGTPFFVNPMWSNAMKVSLEVLLSFIVIDRYIQAFMPEFAKYEHPEVKNKLALKAD